MKFGGKEEPRRWCEYGGGWRDGIGPWGCSGREALPGPRAALEHKRKGNRIETCGKCGVVRGGMWGFGPGGRARDMRRMWRVGGFGCLARS